MQRSRLSLVCVLAAGCGSQSYIMLEVDASLEIPNETNQISVSVRDYLSGEEILATEISLAKGDSFPQRILLAPESEEALESSSSFSGEGLAITVRAQLDDALIAKATALVAWHAGSDNLVEFPPLQPP